MQLTWFNYLHAAEVILVEEIRGKSMVNLNATIYIIIVS